MRPCPVCMDRQTRLFSEVPDRDFDSRTWEVWCCSVCGHGWTEPFPTEEELAAYYPASYIGDTHARMKQFQAGELQRSRSWRKETEKVGLIETVLRTGTILDVGCSDGSFLLALDPDRWDRTGVDLIGEVIEAVRTYFPSLKVRQGDVFSPHLDRESFDVVTFWHVLEHLQDPEKVLRRTEQLLKPSGWVVIAVPRLDSLQSCMFRDCWYAFDVPRHLHHFSAKSLGWLLRRTGLEPVQQHFFSRDVNIHQLKHSLLAWSKSRLRSRIPYYLLKPFLMGFPWIESLSGRYGSITTMARKNSGG